MSSISVIILTLNEEENIGECLDSVQWADQVIVVDSGSTDKTVDIAHEHSAVVLSLPWEGYGATKNRALERTTGEWILWLDADERVMPDLAAEIKELVLRDQASPVAYEVARRAYFLGRWIRHSGWYPSRVTRLFRKGKGRFTEKMVHEQLIIDGSIGRLQHDILHFTDRNLVHYFNKFNRYTSLAAGDMFAGKRQFRWVDLVGRPPFTFLRMYILRAGFLDGIQGLILAVLSATYVFVKYAKLWELEYRNNRKG